MPDLCMLNFGVVDRDACPLREEITDEGDGSSLTSITGVGLERKAKDGKVL